MESIFLLKIKKLVYIPVYFGLIFLSFPLCSQNIPGSSSCNRSKYNFNPDWKFIKDNSASAEKVNYSDAAWSTGSCPQTFNDDDTFDDFIEGNHIGESNQWRGTVWYRKHFKLPAVDRIKKVYIEFESVRQIADVYINGEYLKSVGTHVYAGNSSESNADVTVQAEVQNESALERSIRFEAQIIDNKSKIVSVSKAEQSIGAGEIDSVPENRYVFKFPNLEWKNGEIKAEELFVLCLIPIAIGTYI